MRAEDRRVGVQTSTRGGQRRRAEHGQGPRTKRQGRRPVREAAPEGREQGEGGEDRQHRSFSGGQARRQVGPLRGLVKEGSTSARQRDTLRGTLKDEQR